MGFFEKRRKMKEEQERQHESEEYRRLADQYESGDPMKALRYKEILAEEGDREAQKWVINAYRQGEFIPKNLAKAIEICQQVVNDYPYEWKFYICLADMMREESAGAYTNDIDDVYAQLFELLEEDDIWDEPELEKAYFRYYGKSFPKQHETDDMLLMAAKVAYEDRDYDLACRLMERMKEINRKIWKSWELPQEAQRLYEDAQKKADVISGRTLCTTGEEYADLAEKMEKEEHYEAAFIYADKAAQMGHEYGSVLLAYYYLRGIGVERDQQKGCEAMKQMADAGRSDACYIVGDAYALEGSIWEKDEKMAVLYYQKAAEGGHGAAANSLGEMYETGRGVEQDIVQAEYWYKKSLETENERAAYNLAWIYRKRYIKDKNPSDAAAMMEYYEKVIQSGNVHALTEVGMIYLNGWLGQQQDLKKAEKFLIQAAMQRSGKAQNELVKLYHYKSYGMINEERAFFWARSAAHTGNAEAQYFYGFFCYNGVACRRNTEEGKRWLKKAANKGDERALEAVEFIKANGDW